MAIKVVPFIYKDDDDLKSNCYLLIKDQKCVVIDPSSLTGIDSYILKNNLELVGILLTHGHFDHMRGVDILVNRFHCPVFIGFYDEPKLKDPFLNCSVFATKNHVIVDSKAETVSDNNVLTLLGEDIVCLETPYHTNGSISYYLPDSKMIFTGDFLFAGSVGRDDLPTACPKMFRSSMAKLTALPSETKVYPGHGPFTTIGEELIHNTFVK